MAPDTRPAPILQAETRGGVEWLSDGVAHLELAVLLHVDGTRGRPLLCGAAAERALAHAQVVQPARGPALVVFVHACVVRSGRAGCEIPKRHGKTPACTRCHSPERGTMRAARAAHKNTRGHVRRTRSPCGTPGKRRTMRAARAAHKNTRGHVWRTRSPCGTPGKRGTMRAARTHRLCGIKTHAQPAGMPVERMASHATRTPRRGTRWSLCARSRGWAARPRFL